MTHAQRQAAARAAAAAAAAAANCSPTAADWTAAKTHASQIQAATPNLSLAQWDAQIGALVVSDEIKAAIRYLGQHAPPYEITGRGPRKYVNDMLNAIEGRADPTDPQRRNAPAEYGGKNGLPVTGGPDPQAPATTLAGVFETSARDGFHTNAPRSPNHRDYGKLSVAEAAKPDGNDHKYAVRAKTNDKGYAGLIFTPSRCGGDAYRLRAYVGPESLEFNGQDSAGPVVDTGTLVVWRNIRLFKYFLHNPGIANPPPAVVEIFDWALVQSRSDPTYLMFDVPRTIDKNVAGSWWRHVRDTSVRLGSPAPRAALAYSDPLESPYPAQLTGRAVAGAMNTYRPVDQVQFISLAENFRRCFCDFIADTHGPEPLPESILISAIQAMKAKAATCADVRITVEWDKLFFADIRSPFLLNLRHWMHYNTLKTPAAPRMDQLEVSQIQGVLLNQCYAQMLQAFGQGGVYPGLTLAQFPHSDTWDQHGLGFQEVFPSGVAGSPRTACLFFTQVRYREKMCYSVSSNAAHELGHVLGRSHQPPMPSAQEPRHHPPQPRIAVTPAPGEDSCIMAYQGNYGDFCGKCVLGIRGWKSKIMPAQ